MDIEKPASVVTVKFQWGKQKFDFELDRTDDLDTVKGRRLLVNQPNSIL